MTVTFEGTTPIFRVADLDASVDYYVASLGFEVRWRSDGAACVARDRVRLFLCAGDQGQPGAWAWVGVSDADAVHAELRGRGARVRHPPTNYPWAYELQVEDLDGNVLRLASDDKDGEPIGEWLDADGKCWRYKCERWVRD